MNQIRIVELRNLLNKDDANFKDLIKDFQALLKLEKALTDGLIKFENQLVQISNNEINRTMSKIFLDVATTYKIMNKSRESYLELMEKKIIPSINAQIGEVKDRRNILADYEKKKQAEEKKELTVRTNSDQSKSSSLNIALEDAIRESNQSASNLNNKMRMYINEKNQELESMFQHLINCLLIGNAVGIEKLSELAQTINRSSEEMARETQKILETFLGVSSKPEQKPAAVKLDLK